MPKKAKRPPRVELVELYVCRGWDGNKMADHYECSSGLIYKWLKQVGIYTGPIQPPTKSELEELYLNQRRSAANMSVFYGVTGGTIQRWLNDKDIPIRSRSDAAWDVENRPTRKELYHMVHVKKMQYIDITAKYGVSNSRVCFWLDRFGLPQRDHSLEVPPRDVLMILYREWQLTGLQIAALYDVGDTTVFNWLYKREVPTRDTGFNPHSTAICEDGTVVSSFYEKLVGDWLFRNGFDFAYEPALPFMGNSRADFLVGDIYIEVWGVTGSESYTERRKRKESKYKEHGLDLLGLERHYFNPKYNSYKKYLREGLS